MDKLVSMFKTALPFLAVAVVAIVIDRKTNFVSNLIAKVSPSLVAPPAA